MVQEAAETPLAMQTAGGVGKNKDVSAIIIRCT